MKDYKDSKCWENGVNIYHGKKDQEDVLNKYNISIEIYYLKINIYILYFSKLAELKFIA